MYECTAKVKLDNICADYFAKQKRHGAKQGISTVVTSRELRDSGAKVEENNHCTLHLQKGFGSFNTKLKWET